MSADWPSLKISNIAYFRNNKRIPLKSLDRAKRQGIYPYYGASGVVDYIDDYIFDGTYLLISEDGENLRSRKTPIAFKAHGKFWVNNHAHILEEKEEGVLDYLEYYLSQLDLTPYITGAVQPKLNKANLDSIEIPVPPIEERRAINGMLNALTNKINLNHQINKTLEQMAQAIFKSWFVDFEPVKAKIAALEAGGSEEDALLAAMQAISGKGEAELTRLQAEQPEQYAELRATAELFPSAMQESELGKIPEGWEETGFSDWVAIKRGRSITRAKVVPGDVPVVAGGLEPAYYHNEHNVIGPAITISASGANAGYVNLYHQNIWSSDSSYITKQGTPYFYTAYVCLKYYQKAIFDMQTGAAQPHIYPKDFERLKVVVGSDKLLEQLESLLISFFEQSAALKSESESLAQLRDTLLPKLLSGELSVSAAADQITKAEEVVNVQS